MSTVTDINPATAEEIQTYTLMTDQEATDRLEACHAAFLDRRKLTHHERTPGLGPEAARAGRRRGDPGRQTGLEMTLSRVLEPFPFEWDEQQQSLR